MSGAAQATVGATPTKGALAAFTQKHGWRKWTALNDAALVALIEDKRAAENRMWALGCLWSWGNTNDPREYAVNPKTGKRAKDADFARELSVSKQTVGRWGELLAEKNRLHVLTSGIYPVDDPSKPFKLAQDEVKKFRSMELFGRKYLIYKEEVWDKQNPEKAAYRRKISSELKQFNREILSGFRNWLRSEELEESGTNAEESFHTPEEVVPHSEPESAARQPAYKEERARREIEIDIATPASSSESSLVAAALNEYGKTDDDATNQLINNCRAIAPECTAEQIAAAVHEKAERLLSGKIANPIGFLIAAVPKTITQVAQPASHRATPDHLLPTAVKRQRATVADAEAYARRKPGDEGALRELNDALRRLSELEEDYGL